MGCLTHPQLPQRKAFALYRSHRNLRINVELRLGVRPYKVEKTSCLRQKKIHDQVPTFRICQPDGLSHDAGKVAALVLPCLLPCSESRARLSHRRGFDRMIPLNALAGSGADFVNDLGQPILSSPQDHAMLLTAQHYRVKFNTSGVHITLQIHHLPPHNQLLLPIRSRLYI